MDLDWGLLAAGAALSDDGTIDIVRGGLDTLLVREDSLPTQLQVVWCARVKAPMTQWVEEGHSVAARVQDPSAQSLAKVELPLHESEPPPGMQPGALPGRLLAIPMRWTARAFGNYTLLLLLDGEPVQRSVLAVGPQL